MFTQGEFNHTQNQLDMAIEGGGFFQVIQPNGETGYSRAGTFKLDSDGRVVTSDGFPMEPELTIPVDAMAVSIGTDGTVSVLLAGENQPSEIGNIELANFSEANLDTLAPDTPGPRHRGRGHQHADRSPG